MDFRNANRLVIALFVVFPIILGVDAWALMRFMHLTPDVLTMFISLAGIVLSSLYFFGRNPEQDSPDQGLVSTIKQCLDNENVDIVLKDYEVTNGEIQRRENTTMIVGSFLIAASLLILANNALSTSTTPILAPYAIASIGLYALWLLVLYDTGARINSISYNRIKAIEIALKNKVKYDFGIHNYLFSQTRDQKSQGSASWIESRRAFWGMVLLLISISWLVLSIVKQMPAS